MGLARAGNQAATKAPTLRCTPRSSSKLSITVWRAIWGKDLQVLQQLAHCGKFPLAKVFSQRLPTLCSQ